MSGTEATPSVAGEYFAPGEPAEHPYGVLYQAEWETEWDGTAVAARMHARALAAQGLPVLLKSFSGKVVNADGVPEPVFMAGLPEAVKAEVGTLNETSIDTLAVLIRHMVVRSAPVLEGYLMPRHVVHTDPTRLLNMRRKLLDATIAYTVWERDRVSPGIVEQLSQLGQLWVPCSHNAAMLVRCGVPAEKVQVVPHPYEPTDALCKLTARRPYKERRFYAIGRWEPRKGFHELIGAFMQAFAPGDAATLMIKTGSGVWKGYPSPDESVEQWLRVFSGKWTREKLIEHLTIDTRRYPRGKIVQIHFQNNIYVLSSHGEAFALPARDAKIAGNRLVHVPYGGSADYCETEDIPVPFTMEPDHPSYGWERGAEWAGFTVDALAHALTKATPPAAFARPAHYERVFGFDAVGRQMARLVLGVAEQVDKKAWRYLKGTAKS